MRPALAIAGGLEAGRQGAPLRRRAEAVPRIDGDVDRRDLPRRAHDYAQHHGLLVDAQIVRLAGPVAHPAARGQAHGRRTIDGPRPRPSVRARRRWSRRRTRPARGGSRTRRGGHAPRIGRAVATDHVEDGQRIARPFGGDDLTGLGRRGWRSGRWPSLPRLGGRPRRARTPGWRHRIGGGFGRTFGRLGFGRRRRWLKYGGGRRVELHGGLPAGRCGGRRALGLGRPRRHQHGGP